MIKTVNRKKAKLVRASERRAVEGQFQKLDTRSKDSSLMMKSRKNTVIDILGSFYHVATFPPAPSQL